MKAIVFEKSTDLKKRLKSIVVTQTTEDAESVTVLSKGFKYHVCPTPVLKPQHEKPQVFINKFIDTKQAIETFDFKVKGRFFVVDNRMSYKVDFEHDLNIEIHWKSKIFSPKKSVVLTE